MDFDFLANHAESIPEKPAVICNGEVLDFVTLSKRASRAANVFVDLGCKEGDRVAWMSFNSIAGAEIANGLRRAGLVIVPVNYRLRGPEIAFVVSDSGARIAAAGPDHVEVMAAATGEVDAVRFVAAADNVPPGWISYRDLMGRASEQFDGVGAGGLGASMIYTSGTTGNPKGAWRPHGVDIANVLQVISIFELAQSDVHLVCGPGYHSGVAFFSALHQVLGSTVVLQPKFEAEDALDLIERHRVTTTFTAPTLLHRLVDAQERRPRDTSSLRALIIGAAPCPYVLKVRAEAVFGRVLWEFYGATETGINTVLRPEDQMRKPGSCGTAVPGQEIRLVRDDGAEAAIGEPGQLMVRNNWQAEYFNRPDATSESLHDGFFSVGDVAYRDDEGYYYICDRRIDMIISGGVNIYPAEIESVLLTHPKVGDAAVFGIPHDDWGEEVKAVVEPAEGIEPGPVLADELMGFASERLAKYKLPRTIDFVPELPRDPNGKLYKRKLRDPYWEGRARAI